MENFDNQKIFKNTLRITKKIFYIAGKSERFSYNTIKKKKLSEKNVQVGWANLLLRIEYPQNRKNKYNQSRLLLKNSKQERNLSNSTNFYLLCLVIFTCFSIFELNLEKNRAFMSEVCVAANFSFIYFHGRFTKLLVLQYRVHTSFLLSFFFLWQKMSYIPCRINIKIIIALNPLPWVGCVKPHPSLH